jgi:hypothetical protein
MAKTLIAIASYNRPYKIEKRMGYWIKNIKNADVRVFVCPDQAMYYEQSVGSDMLIEGAKQGEKNGHPMQLEFIKNWAKENGYDYVLKCDDDMVFKANGYKKPVHAEMIDKSITTIEKRFENDPNLSAVAYCQPIEYLHSEKDGFKKRNKNFSGNYYIRVDRWHLKTHIPIFEDIFVWLELKVLGLGKCETFYGLYQDASVGDGEGGYQSFDRYTMSLKSYEDMKICYPELQLKSEEAMKGKTGHDIGKRIDTSYYKKI